MIYFSAPNIIVTLDVQKTNNKYKRFDLFPLFDHCLDNYSFPVHLSEVCLTLTLGVENKNTDKSLDFTTALHTYMRY